MVQHIVLLLETFLILYCFHVINDKKMQLDIASILFVLGNVLFWEIANIFPNDRVHDWIVYVAYIVFDRYYFKNIWKKALVDWGIGILCVALCQLIGIGVGNVIGFQDDILALMGIIIACGVAKIVLPRLKLQHFYAALMKYLPYIGMIMGVFLIEICLVLFQSRFQHKIQMEIYMLTIPILFGIIGIVVKLLQKNNETEEIKTELELTNQLHGRYENLLENIRDRQHGFNNQITAILGTHYVCKTYEELIKNQKELCKVVMNDNKYNKLLWLRNDVLAGFMFQKLKEIDEANVEIDLEVSTTDFSLNIPIQYLIEMIGILLDNAYEAVIAFEGVQVIAIQFLNENGLLVLNILNPSPYVEYDNISKMFIKGVSSKGQGRGIGLARVSEICEKYNCEILCENVNKQNMNWIKFSIIAKKAER